MPKPAKIPATAASSRPKRNPEPKQTSDPSGDSDSSESSTEKQTETADTIRAMLPSNRKIPTLPIKLCGATTYPKWIISIEKYLNLIPIGTTEYSVWDIVLGDYERPVVPKDKASDEAASNAKIELRAWKDADNIGLLTIQKNCGDDILTKIGNETSAKGAYDKLKKAYEGKTVTEFYTLLDSLLLKYDDENDTIETHITKYERAWHTFAGVIFQADLEKDTGFGKGLRVFAHCDQAKAEFLLRSLPPLYSNIIDNIRTKEYNTSIMML